MRVYIGDVNVNNPSIKEMKVESIFKKHSDCRGNEELYPLFKITNGKNSLYTNFRYKIDGTWEADRNRRKISFCHSGFHSCNISNLKGYLSYDADLFQVETKGLLITSSVKCVSGNIKFTKKIEISKKSKNEFFEKIIELILNGSFHEYINKEFAKSCRLPYDNFVFSMNKAKNDNIELHRLFYPTYMIVAKLFSDCGVRHYEDVIMDKMFEILKPYILAESE